MIVHEAAPVEGPAIDLTDRAVGIDAALNGVRRFGVLREVGGAAVDAARGVGRTAHEVRLSQGSWALRRSLAFWWRRSHDEEILGRDGRGVVELIEPRGTGTIELRTARLRLTTCARFAAATATDYFRAIHGSNVFDTILWNGPSSPGEIADAALGFERDLHRGPRSPVVFSIADRAGGRRIGGCGYRPSAADPARGEIGYMLEPGSHGQGLATEAVGALVAFAFTWRCARRIEAVVFVGNDASRRVLEKLGFARECTALRGGQKRGEARDEWRFGLTAAEVAMPEIVFEGAE